MKKLSPVCAIHGDEKGVIGGVVASASAGVSAAVDSTGTAAFSSLLAVPPSRPRYANVD